MRTDAIHSREDKRTAAGAAILPTLQESPYMDLRLDSPSFTFVRCCRATMDPVTIAIQSSKMNPNVCLCNMTRLFVIAKPKTAIGKCFVSVEGQLSRLMSSRAPLYYRLQAWPVNLTPVSIRYTVLCTNDLLSVKYYVLDDLFHFCP